MNKEKPAFPRPHMGDSGMSLHDYLAGQALIGIVSANEEKNLADYKYPLICAQLAYDYADAMMKARGE